MAIATVANYKFAPTMPAFCSLLLLSYFSKNYAGKISSSLFNYHNYYNMHYHNVYHDNSAIYTYATILYNIAIATSNKSYSYIAIHTETVEIAS